MTRGPQILQPAPPENAGIFEWPGQCLGDTYTSCIFISFTRQLYPEGTVGLQPPERPSVGVANPQAWPWSGLTRLTGSVSLATPGPPFPYLQSGVRRGAQKAQAAPDSWRLAESSRWPQQERHLSSELHGRGKGGKQRGHCFRNVGSWIRELPPFSPFLHPLPPNTPRTHTPLFLPRVTVASLTNVQPCGLEEKRLVKGTGKANTLEGNIWTE